MRCTFTKKLIPIYICIITLMITATYFGSKAITSFYENDAIKTNSILIIDAGHGGVDGGATSCTGVLESHINLQIALRLDDLMHLLGISTVMIRKEDISVHTEGKTIAAKKISDLRNRVKTVNDIPNSILISIHQNYFSENQYSGAQIFCGTNAESRIFAETMQKRINASLCRDSNRKVKKGTGIYLMEKIKGTGVLIECGFISNPAEEQKLNDHEYQKKLCCVIASATSQYLTNNPIA